MGRGYRWMYHLTGLPGWMRGRGSGWHGPGCWHGGGPEYGAGPYAPGPHWPGPHWPGPWGTAPTVEDEVAFLKDEGEALRNYLEGIERRIGELERTEK